MSIVPEKLYFVITACDTRFEPTKSESGGEVWYDAAMKNGVARGVFFDENGNQRDDAHLVLTNEMIALGIACTRNGGLYIRPATSGSDKVFIKAKVRDTEYTTEEEVGLDNLYQFSLVLEPVE